MKKFIVLYHAPSEALSSMDDLTDEQRAEGMKPWMVWAEKCGDHLVDLGTPLIAGQRLSPDGSNSPSTKDVAGYSILQANNIEEAKSFLNGHPHLTWRADCDIEIHESVPM